MARQITHIVIHCTGTVQHASVGSIQNYWKEKMGWNSPGYHVIIRADGSTAILQDYEKKTNGVAGHNEHSIHICYIGGIDALGKPYDNRTLEQLHTMKVIVQALKQQYPTAIVCGHRDFPGVKKACPSFDVARWIKKEQIL